VSFCTLVFLHAKLQVMLTSVKYRPLGVHALRYVHFKTCFDDDRSSSVWPDPPENRSEVDFTLFTGHEGP
jgi:hypothetical protein